MYYVSQGVNWLINLARKQGVERILRKCNSVILNVCMYVCMYALLNQDLSIKFNIVCALM